MIISDRWPSSAPSTMDGPKLYNSENSFLIKSLNNIVLYIYRLIPEADLIIFLETDIKFILERNKARMNPEPEEYILLRYKNAKNCKPIGKKIIFYKNDKVLEEAVQDCFKEICMQLNKD